MTYINEDGFECHGQITHSELKEMETSRELKLIKKYGSAEQPIKPYRKYDLNTWPLRLN